MSGALRLFVAIEPPPDLLDALSDLQEDLRRQAPGLRWVRPEGMHLTLKFISGLAEERVGEVQAALERVPPFTPFTITTGAAGTFGGNRARVLWLGLEGETEPLLGLQRNVNGALAEAGIVARDEQPYRPHLTLARVPDRASPEERRAVRELAERLTIGPLPLAVDGFALVESRPGPGGARYRNLGRIGARIP